MLGKWGCGWGYSIWNEALLFCLIRYLQTGGLLPDLILVKSSKWKTVTEILHPQFHINMMYESILVTFLQGALCALVQCKLCLSAWILCDAEYVKIDMLLYCLTSVVFQCIFLKCYIMLFRLNEKINVVSFQSWCTEDENVRTVGGAKTRLK